MTDSYDKSTQDSTKVMSDYVLQSSRCLLSMDQCAEEELSFTKKDLEKQTKELRASASLLQATLESSQDGIIAVGLDGEITHFNSKFVIMWELPRKLLESKCLQIINGYISKIVCNPEKLLQPVNSQLAIGESKAEEYKLKDGRIFERYETAQWINNKRSGVVISWRDVTKKRETEQALFNSERLNNTILSSSERMIIATDLKGIVILFNRAAEQCLGYKPCEVIGMHTPVLWHDRGQLIRRGNKLKMNINQTLESGFGIFIQDYLINGGETREWTFVRKNGTRFPALLTVTMLRNEKNEITGFLNEVQDLTEKRKMEEQLADAGRILEEAFNEVYIFDADTLHFMQVNRGARENIQYSMDELYKMVPVDIIPDFTLPEFDKLLLSLIKNTTKESIVFETRHQRKDGSVYPVEVRLQTSLYLGKPVFVTFVIDNTSRKSAEEKIRQQQKELQLIFDHVPVGILFKDDNNLILRINKQAALSLGGCVKDFEGKSVYELFPIQAKNLHQRDLNVIKSNVPEMNVVEKIELEAGNSSWVSKARIPYTDPLTKKSYIFMCYQDITAQKNAEIKHQKLIEQLKLTNDELEKFAYIASHDLKSPLRGIEQLAGWIHDDCQKILPDGSKKHLKLLSSRISRMETLLDDLLAYSRVDQMSFHVEKIHLDTVLFSLLDLISTPFGFTHTLNLSHNEIFIARKPFEIVARNLIANAVKHHHENKGHIEITYNLSEDYHEFYFVDDGPGIKLEMHEVVFEMFQTLKPRDDVEGSGMGLATIKKIINHYGGEIQIMSDGVLGTVFKVLWPCQKIN